MACKRYAESYHRDNDIRYCIEEAVIEYINKRTSDPDMAFDLSQMIKTRTLVLSHPRLVRVLKLAMKDIEYVMRFG